MRIEWAGPPTAIPPRYYALALHLAHAQIKVLFILSYSFDFYFRFLAVIIFRLNPRTRALAFGAFIFENMIRRL